MRYFCCQNLASTVVIFRKYVASFNRQLFKQKQRKYLYMAQTYKTQRFTHQLLIEDEEEEKR